MKKIYMKIDGIHCEHCEVKIKEQLLKNKKIKDVIFDGNIACISYVGKLKNSELIDSIIDIDYFTKDEYISNNINDLLDRVKLLEFIIIFFVIIVLFLFIKLLFGFNIFNVIPNINSNITYGMLFVTGLLTSIHCISMCGAINLMASVSTNRNFKRPIVYNLGRVISYTLIGGVCGLVGSVISFNETFKGIIILFASILMFLMSLKMLGIINFKFPKLLKFRFNNKSRNSFVVGLLNGFMPCGPLQAMQVYALSTGSFFNGALSMFLFSLGTVPLMLSVGFIFNIVNGKLKILLNKIASVLILILSLVMLNRAFLSFNIDVTKIFKDYGNYTSSVLVDDYQLVEFDLDYSHYEDIIVQKDIPVKIIIHVNKKYLTGCNNEIHIKEYGIEKELVEGDNIIEFIPNSEGVFTYTCWMNMIKNNIKVIDDIDYFK